MLTGSKEKTVTTGTRHPLSAPTRRERQRAATYEEIVTVARALLGSPDSLSLRAVAAEMGLTAPALYRYVDSYQELLMVVARAIFTDVISAMTSARDRYRDDDPAAQILASTAAFRRWAMTHPGEFGLVFANAATAEATETVNPADPSSHGGGAHFSDFFTDIFLRVWDRYQFTLPADSDLEPGLLERLHELREDGTLPCDFPGRPLGLSWVFIRCWTRLYGTITLEVFRHMDLGVIASGALFRAMLEDNARDLGFGDDWPRLRDLVELEMSREVAGDDEHP
jgi:AcrR family transcriptional regulator